MTDVTFHSAIGNRQSAIGSPFCKLADPAGYVACSWDLAADVDGRLHWVDFFKRHFRTILKFGVEARMSRGESHDALRAAAARCAGELDGRIDAFAANPADFGRVTILTLDNWRDESLRKHGFADAFIDVKDRENASALPLVSVVCRQIDALSGAEQLRAVVEGVFAGNIFDMGAEATTKAFMDHGPDFFATRRALAPRPWLIDHYDALAQRVLQGPVHRKAVIFIDNAGSDFLLGAVPMIRWLAQRGTRVVIAANERPTLNDMTIHDLSAWWPRVIAAEPSLATLPIERVSTGTGEPLIDLAAVSPALNDAADGADLIVLEGMGRGVESNLDASFTCDALSLAMIKDTAVARRVGGKVFDVVCRFRAIA